MAALSTRADRGALRQHVLSGIDLVIDFATLGGYGLEPSFAHASRRQGTDRHCRAEPPEPVNFREAIRRFAA